MDKFAAFYRKVGIRRITDIDKSSSIKGYPLPLNTNIHYLDFFTKNCVLSPFDVLVTSNIKRIFYAKNVYELEQTLGNPKHLKPKRDLLRTCVRSTDPYKKLLKGIEELTLPSGIILYNYLPLNSLYKYKKKKTTPAFKVSNVVKTMVVSLNEAAEKTPERVNFIYLETLTGVPSERFFKKMVDKDEKYLAKTVREENIYLAIQLTKYSLGVSSIFGELSKKAAERTALLFKTGDTFSLITLTNMTMVSTEDKRGLMKGELKTISLVRSLLASKVPDNRDMFEAAEVIELSPEETIEESKEILKVEAPDVKAKSVKDSIVAAVDRQADILDFSSQKKHTLKKKASELLIKDPVTGVNIEDIEVYKEPLKPKLRLDNKAVFDKSMLSSTIEDFTKLYIDKRLYPDIARMVYNIQKHGIIIHSFDSIPHRSIVGDYTEYRLSMTLVSGGRSTIRWRIPVVNSAGTFMSNGTEYTMRIQRTEAPISKINKSSVSLSSYYGGLIIKRSDLSSQNYDTAIRNMLVKLNLDGVIDLVAGDALEEHEELPRIYTSLSQIAVALTYEGKTLAPVYANREKLLNKGDTLKKVEKDGVLIGKKGKSYITVGEDNLFRIAGVETGDLWSTMAIKKPGTEAIVEVANKDVAVMMIMGRRLPVGFALGFLLGLPGLIKLLGAKASPIKKLARVTDGMKIRFNDVSLHVTELTPVATLVLQAFVNNVATVSNYNFKEFATKDVYHVILEAMNLYSGSLDEVARQRDLFVEPLTEDVLKEMKETTSYISLVLRAVELISTDKVPNLNTKAGVKYAERFKGYERIPGAIYAELMLSIREAERKINLSKKKVEMSPYAVWQRITQDPAVDLVKAINPVQELKEKEAVILTGTGGRSKDTITAKDRTFRETDLGKISEATPDSGDVGISAYLAPGAKITSLTGFSDSIDDVKDNPSAALSTAALLTPIAQNDDAKRLNMISVQAGHSVAVSGKELPYVRTGADILLGSKLSPKFASTASGPGKVALITKEAIQVKYKDKSTDSFPLGEQFLQSGGKTFPSTLKTDFKKGDIVKTGDMLTYNADFFMDDPISGKKIYQNKTYGLVALIEDATTYEDGCSVSEALAEKLGSKLSKPLEFVIEGDKELSNFPKIGLKTHPSDSLFVIHTPTADGVALDQESIDALKDIGANSPSAKYAGEVKEIVLFYHGDRSEFSSSVNRLITEENSKLKAKAKAMGTEPYTCEVDDEFRIRGKSLPYGSIYLKIQIAGLDELSTADKLIFSSAAKSTVAVIYPTGSIRTEDGRDVDARFSYKGISARLISAIEQSTLNSIMEALPAHCLKLLAK